MPLARRVPWYPVVLTAAFIVNFYVESGISHAAVIRPLIVAITATSILTIVASVLVRSRHIGAFISGAVLVLMAGWRSPVLLAATFVLCVAALLLIPRTRWAGKVSWPGLTRALNIASLFLFVGIGIQSRPGWDTCGVPRDMHQGGPLVTATTPAPSAAPPGHLRGPA